MQIEDDVETLRAQTSRERDIVTKPGQSAAAGDDDHFCEVRVPGYYWRRLALDQIRQPRVRKRPLERADERRGEDDVADEAKANEEYLHVTGVRRHAGLHELGFDSGLVQQHDGDVVLDRIDALALTAFQRGAVLDELNLGLAVGAGQYLEQFRIDGHGIDLGSERLPAAGTIPDAVCVPRPADVIIVRQMRSFLPTIMALVLAGPGVAMAGQRAPSAGEQGDASYYFLLARHFEGAGNVDEAS